MAVTNGSDDNATNTGSTGNDGQHRDLLAGRLARLRDQLLDFSNRNRLISFKHSDRARTHIRVIDELPDVLFAKLCDGDKLTFLALPEPETEPPDENTPDFQIEFEAARLTDEEYRQAISRLDPDDVSAPDAERIERDLCDRVREKLGMPPWIDESKLSRADFARQYDLEPTYDLPFPREAGDDPERQLDDEMQTLLFPREMDRKLGGIHDQARTMFQEAGISTLRAAFGFLEWYESEISERAHLAPLLLMPVEMERRRSRPWRKYLLYSESAEVETNKTLAIRLEREFGFDLPEFEDDDTPERYLARVSEAVEPHSRWRVRRFLTVGNFGFSKLAMYNDLDPNTWPKSSSILDHTLVGEMLLGSPQSDGSSFSAPDYDIDTEEIDRKAVCLVLNADASQYSAILDALEGKNLVIKGPPGTGKSQTIANLIAAGLAAGKRILFVAEKMAALDVVYSRLKDVGLTEFCLELHANKGPKTAVLDSLRQRLEVQDQIHLPDTFEAKREELRNLRDQLNEYVSEVNKPVGALGKTFQEILWASQRAQMAAGNIFDAVKNFRLPNVLDLSLVEMSSAIHAIEVAFATRESFGSEFGSGNSHPWGWVGNGNMNPFDVEETQEETRKWHHLLVNLNHALGEIKDSYGLTDISTLNDIEDLIGFLDELPSVPSQTVRWTATALQEGDLRAAGQKFVDLNKLGTTNTGDSSQIDIITNLPPVGRDWSTHANRLIKEIDILLNFSSQIQTLQSAEELSVVKETLLSDADAFLECVRSVQQACGVSESTEKVALVFTITFLEVLHSVSREVLTRRHSMIMDETSGPILVRAAEKSREAESQRNKLEETFVLQPLPPLQEVNRHAAALRGAGRFALFSTEVSEAKKFYRSISSRKKRADTARMASDLTELGINLATVRELAEDSSLREICGQWFMGADTEFGVLLEAQEWGCQVRAKFATTGEISSSMRCLLLDGDIEVLDRLIALIPHEKAVERIRFIFREATDSSNMEHKVASDRAALNTFQLAIANLKSAGIGRNIALQDVRRAIESIRELETFRQALQSTRDDYISGAGDNLLSEVSAEDIRSALEHLTRISESSAPPSVINCLCSPSAETFREKLKEWGQDQRDKIALERSSRERIISLTSLLPLELCQRESVGECEINSIIDRLGFAIERMDTLTQWTDFLRSTGAIDQLGLSELNTKLKETPATAETAKAAYETLVYNALARAAYERCPTLSRI